MSMNRDAFAALLLLAAFAGYGYQATLIQLFPGQETEVFSPRSMPYALAIGGIVLSALQLMASLRTTGQPRASLAGFDWPRVLLLCLDMIVYGLLFERLGFVLSTALFLAAGFAILGERRWWLLSAVPLAFSGLFWLVMTRLLGLYLAPGLFGD